MNKEQQIEEMAKVVEKMPLIIEQDWRSIRAYTTDELAEYFYNAGYRKQSKTEYYVVRDKNTGLYFRGKGVNRWGKYYNQASIYRLRANAENTIRECSWRGEQCEIVTITITEKGR